MSEKNGQREGGPKNVWHRKGPTWRIGDEVFKFSMPRGGKENWNITPLVEAASWDDAEAVMTGSLSLRYPDERRLSIEVGDEVECLYAKEGGGSYQTIWKMRIVDPEYDPGEGAFTCSLEDDLALLARSKDDWRFVKGEKKHKEGWPTHKIAAEVCERYHVKADLAKGEHKFKRFEKKDTSPLDVINHVYAKEREHTGRRYVVHFINGVLKVEVLRRNTFLALLKEQILTALYAQGRHKEFATVITMRGSTDKKKKDDKREKKKLEVVVESKEMRKRFGYIHRFEDRKNLDTKEEMRTIGERQLAKKAELKHTIQISHLGIPNIRRGDAVRVDLTQVPHFSTPRIVFVKEAHHSLASGDYSMELILGEDDPYRDAKKERECIKKCEKAAKHGDEAPKECDCPKWIDFKKGSEKGDKGNQRSGDDDSGDGRRGDPIPGLEVIHGGGGG